MEDSLFSLAMAFLLDLQFAETAPKKERRDSLLYQCQRRTFKNKAKEAPLSIFEQQILDHMEKDQYPSHKRNFQLALGDIILLCQQSKGWKQTVDTLTQLRTVYIANKIYSQANKTIVETICYVLCNTTTDPNHPMLP